MAYYVKQLGSDKYPVQDDEHNQINYLMHFQKTGRNNKNPPNICKGDILIAIGVKQSQRVLSIYKIMSTPDQATIENCPDEDIRKRWPWVAETINLTLKFGKEWQKHDLQLETLRKTFINFNPKENVTLKKQTLGALLRGSGYLQINPKFAEFIIKEVEKCTGEKLLTPSTNVK